MTSVGYNFLCGRPHDAAPPPVRRRLPELDPPPRGRHKWVAPKATDKDIIIFHQFKIYLEKFRTAWNVS